MKRVLCIVALAAAGAVAAPPRPPDSAAWAEAMSAPPGRVVTKLADLPLDECRAIEAAVGPIAREGESFQSSDLVLDGSLPWRRFAWARDTGDTVVVALEHCGIGEHTDMLLLKRDAKTATWSSAAEAGTSLDTRRGAPGRTQLQERRVHWSDTDVGGVPFPHGGPAPKSGCDRFVVPAGGDPLTRSLAVLAHADRVELAGDNAPAFDVVVAQASTAQISALLADANPAARALAAAAWVARKDVDAGVVSPLLHDAAVVSDQMFSRSATSVANVVASALCQAGRDPTRAGAEQLLVRSADEAFDAPPSDMRDEIVATALACKVDDVRLDRLAVKDVAAIADAPFRIIGFRGAHVAIERAAHTTSPEVERDAITALQHIPTSPVAAPLRVRAARELASADAPGAADVLKPMLTDADREVRDAAVRAFAVLSTTSDDDIRRYFADRATVAPVAAALAEKRDARSLRLLEMLLMHLDVEAGYARDALHVLEEHRDANVDALVAKLESSSTPEIAHWAHAVRAGVKNASRVLR